MLDIPDLAEIRQIATDRTSGADVVNLRITHAYHQLSEAIRDELGAGPNLDWCGFAKWSSYTVGHHFDDAATPARFDILATYLGDIVPGLSGFHPALVQLFKRAATLEDGLMPKTLRGGNAAIFAEMAVAFWHLLDRLPTGRARNVSDHEFAVGVARDILKSHEELFLPPLDRSMLQPAPTAALVRAIEFYLWADRETDRQAELMLAGNVLFSVFEQTRADRLIAIGSFAPIRASLLPVTHPLAGSARRRRVLLAGANDNGGVLGLAETRFARWITDVALVVSIAGVQVRLGHPEWLPPPEVNTTLPETEKVMDDVARGAVGQRPNWVDLSYRLAFIARYFAAYQQNPVATSEPPPPATSHN
jgi:hypothetical protein